MVLSNKLCMLLAYIGAEAISVVAFSFVNDLLTLSLVLSIEVYKLI